MLSRQAVASGVWGGLIGQDRVVEVLQRAVLGDKNAMTHGWLFAGPPGSGRSVAARAFAAALQCEQGGCGECLTCRTVLNGTHPDVQLVNTERLNIGVDEIRELARKGSMSPTLGTWQIIVVEDADRITERGADALLKSLEEPPPRTVWILCAPNAEDLIVTIRSRLRKVQLTTPSDEQVAELLVQRDGVELSMARTAARAAQGHIGRARALAVNPEMLQARRDTLLIPSRLISVEACLSIAQQLIESTTEQAKRLTADLEETERAELLTALGVKGARGDTAFKELEEQQKLRAKRMQRDALDQVLTELATWYRDVLSTQLEASQTDEDGSRLINIELVPEITKSARSSSPEQTIARLDALIAARTALERNVTPLLAMEALLLELAHPGA